jgi:hypothetical protein
MTLDDVRNRLSQLSEEMTLLIRRYGLKADSPLEVIAQAKSQISDQEDYLRFLELSLEGRILADEGDRLKNIQYLSTPLQMGGNGSPQA